MSKISIDVGNQKVITPEIGAIIYKALEGWLLKLGDVRDNVEVITVKVNSIDRSERPIQFKAVIIDPMGVSNGIIIRAELREKYEPQFMAYTEQLVDERVAIEFIQKHLTDQTIYLLNKRINDLQNNCEEIRDIMGPIRNAGKP